MAQPCKVFSYTNVGTEKGCSPTCQCARPGGGRWTKTPWTPRRMYLHSGAAGTPAALFFAAALCRRTTTRSVFCWPCTAYGVRRFRGMGRAAAGSPKGWRNALCSATTGKPICSGPRENTASRPRAGGFLAGRPPNTNSCWAARHSSCARCGWSYTFSDGGQITRISGWVGASVFGAADGVGMPSRTSTWCVVVRRGARTARMGLMLPRCTVAQRDVNHEYYFCTTNYGPTLGGCPLEGGQCREILRPRGPTATAEPALRPAWSAPASPVRNVIGRE